MACYKPLVAWRGPMQPSGKKSIVFDRRESTSPVELRLPCGQCIGCRLAYSRNWAIRCLNEAQMHKENCFITLTYDNEHKPKDGGLHVEDWQKFAKRLRKFVRRPIRYFHAGEYGEKFGRPHYHALLFGYDFKDRRLLKSTSAGSAIYSSRTLSNVWGNGYCSIGDVTFESAAYVARYCLKKITGKEKEIENVAGFKPYERLDVASGVISEVRPEYVTMSRRPGIGRNWFEKFKRDIYPAGVVVARGGTKMSPPRYYDGLYELENPLDMERIKLHRIERAQKKELVYNDVLKKFQLLDVNRDERLKVMEEVKQKTMSRFARGKMESGQ